MTKWLRAVAFPQDKLAHDGYAVFPRELIARNGQPAGHIFIKREGGADRPLVLKVQLTSGKFADIAVSQTSFQAMAAAGDQVGTPVEYRDAGFWTRAWARPATRLELIIAVLAFAATIVAAVSALVTAFVKSSSPGAPLWLAIAVFALVTLAALAKLVQDLRKSAQ